MTQTDQIELRCEQCGRAAGAEMIACPERASGGCPYLLEQVGGGKGSCLVLTVLVLLLALVVLVVGVQQGDVFSTMLALVVALGLGSAGVLGIANLLSKPSNMLFNQETGAAWSHIELLGRVYTEQITLPAQPVDLGIETHLALDYPSSVAALRPDLLNSDGHAVQVLTCTLVSLLGRGLLAVRMAQRFKAVLGGPYKLDAVLYLLEPGPQAGREVVAGALEGRIMRAVLEWHFNSVDADRHVRLLTVGWTFPPRHGIQIHSLVYELFDHEELEPTGWLVQLVHQDALTKGLWQRVASDWRRGRSYYEISPHVSRMKDECDRVLALRNRLSQTHPGLVAAIQAQVEQGIRARQAD